MTKTIVFTMVMVKPNYEFLKLTIVIILMIASLGYLVVNICEGSERQYRKFHKLDNGAEEML